MYKIIKTCIKSEFKEIILKLVTNGPSDLGFLLSSKLCHQGAVCSWPGAKYMHENIKKYVQNQTSK